MTDQPPPAGVITFALAGEVYKFDVYPHPTDQTQDTAFLLRVSGGGDVLGVRFMLRPMAGASGGRFEVIDLLTAEPLRDMLGNPVYVHWFATIVERYIPEEESQT